jgi:hypothetical protein
VWQEVRNELHPYGLEVVTVAMDIGGAEVARPYIEAAKATHPSVVDQAHILGELFGVVNVRYGLWIDEAGVIVRPAEPAHPPRSHMEQFADIDITRLPPQEADMLAEARKIRLEPKVYMSALRDWIENGADSRYALSPQEVVARSHSRTREVAEATASFELGQHLHRSGFPDDAMIWFRRAHRLQDDNWTYKREAWSPVDTRLAASRFYDGDWLSDVRRVGIDSYYHPLNFD